MGLFDTILIDTMCPHCNHINFEGQTKDLENYLNVYRPRNNIGRLYRFVSCFHICDRLICSKSYSFKVKVDDNGILTKLIYDIEEENEN